MLEEGADELFLLPSPFPPTLDTGPEQCEGNGQRGAQFCPHTAAIIYGFCAKAMSGIALGQVAPRVVSYLAPSRHTGKNEPHYPQRPWIPLKLGALNVQFRLETSAPTSAVLVQYHDLLLSFYTALWTAVRDVNDPGESVIARYCDMATARVSTVARRRACLSDGRTQQPFLMVVPGRPRSV